MKTVIILGAGQFGRAVSRLLNTEQMDLIAFGDNNPALHHMGEEDRIRMGFPPPMTRLPIRIVFVWFLYMFLPSFCILLPVRTASSHR